MDKFFLILKDKNLGIIGKLKNWKKFIGLIIIFNYQIFSQNYVASPSIWIFPNCDPQSTNHQLIKSKPQNIKDFTIKWRNNSISGDVQPFVGNIINDPPIDSNFAFAPNEIVAIRGGKIVLVDSKGYTHRTNSIPIPFVNNISFLFDTLSWSYYPLPNSTLLLGLETIEFENKKDTLIYTYIAGYDPIADTIKLIKRIVIDQRTYNPNLFGSLKPFFGKKYGNDFFLFACSNIFNPKVSDSNPTTSPFFRGFTIFPSSSIVNTFPLPDITDNNFFRVTLGPVVSFAPPSLHAFGTNHWVLLPNYQTPNLDVNIPNNISITKTNPTKSYLFCYNLVGDQIRQVIPPLELTSLLDSKGKRAQIRPFFVFLNDSSTPDSLFILVAEEYRGIDSSFGLSSLHLFDGNFSALTFPNDPFSPSFNGMNNVVWSIAIGNVDGNPQNKWLPYYPNNPGNEIIATFSSPHHTIPENKLLILKYNNSNPIPKPSPPGTFLFPFDTICTFTTSGWVAVVNDINGADDQKEEIILVDGSTIRILQLRNYDSFEFKLGRPFDTLWSYEFSNETIHKVLVADLDGDALNDIIVTTNNFTYLIGTPLPKPIEITNPRYTPNPLDICIGDSIMINLRSKSIAEEKINIRFVPIVNGFHQFSNSKIELENISITKPTTTLQLHIDTSFANKAGIFYIESSYVSGKIFDSTSIFNFNMPTIVFDSTINSTFYFDDIQLDYFSRCADSVIFEFSLDGTTWFFIASDTLTMPVQSIRFSLPCLNYFECGTVTPHANVFFRNRLFFKQYEIISQPILINIKPKSYTIAVSDINDFCASKTFSWDPTDVNCDTFEILISIDGGSNYYLIDKISSAVGQYEWKCRTNLPDSILFRFCCRQSCKIGDTIVYVPKPKYIKTVAPNPFNPFHGYTEISYIVERETNTTIRVLDENNRLVRQLVSNILRQPNIVYCEQWDGKTDFGDIVAPGLYYILIEFSIGTKEIFPIFVK
ncbi:MAG: hypothetical protein ACUVQ1_06035 [Candidatus Kapaibacteriales bacterium]